MAEEQPNSMILEDGIKPNMNLLFEIILDLIYNKKKKKKKKKKTQCVCVYIYIYIYIYFVVCTWVHLFNIKTKFF